MEALADADQDRCREQCRGRHVGASACGEHEQASAEEHPPCQRHHHGPPAALGEHGDRHLGYGHRGGIGEQQQPDELRADAHLAHGVGRYEPGEHAPTDRDHRHVRQRELDERAVTNHEPVPARDRLRSRVLAHHDDQYAHIDQVGHAVGQEQHHEPGQAVRRDEATNPAADPDADVGGNPCDRGGAMAQLLRCERRDER